MGRIPQPRKREMKKESKKQRNKGERLIKTGVKNLIDSIFKN